MAQRFKSFAEFWPFYVGEHSKPLTRIYHFIGTATLIPLVVLTLFHNIYIALLLPLSGYGFAWYSHYFIEKNRPATFVYPFWSLLGDFKMFGLMCTGRMDAEVKRCEQVNTERSLEDVATDDAIDGM